MPYRQLAVAGLPAVALRGQQLELVAVPSAGHRISHLRRPRGREWLWHNPHLPIAPPGPDQRPDAYVLTADSGGWDECFPTVAPSPLPEAPELQLPDHGELWSSEWSSSLTSGADGVTLTGIAIGRRIPYEFRREITVHPTEPEARFRYRLRHLGDRAFHWIWSAHPLINVQSGTLIELPGVSQVTIGSVAGRSDLAVGDIVSWPGAVGGEALRFRFPGEAGWAVKLFGDLASDGRMALVDPRRGERLEITVDPAEVPQVGVWINAGGWAPAGRPHYCNLGLEPCIGAPDALADAVRWGTAPLLEPGAERSWGLTVRLPEAEPER